MSGREERAPASPAAASGTWRPTRPGALALVVHQFRYDALVFLRNWQSRFFTLLLPVVFLLIFATVFRNRTVPVPGGPLSTSVYYVPGILALAVITASLNNLVTSMTHLRDANILRRRRAAPIPAAALVAARAATAAGIALAMTTMLATIGWLVYGAYIPVGHVVALVATVVVGAGAFTSLGFALTTVIRDADAAAPVIAASTLPLYFISGVFLPAAQLPSWLLTVASVFPVRHFQLALLSAYNPYSAGAGFAGTDLLIMAGWGVLGLVVAVSRFRWAPRSH
jgi:ABC-2 type transport system permease protein